MSPGGYWCAALAYQVRGFEFESVNPELRGRKKGRFENRAVGIGIDD
jgi:hypothetical protein